MADLQLAKTAEEDERLQLAIPTLLNNLRFLPQASP
jgi:hypothetical protein